MSEDAKVAEELYRTLGEVRAQLTAAREAAAKDREDAERYRTMRAAGWEPDGDSALWSQINAAMTGEQLDAAIDGARRQP